MTMQEKMQLALRESEKCYATGDVPIGAIVFAGDTIIGKGHNQVEFSTNSLKHAEIIAIEHAIARRGSKYLSGCELVVTLEPCPMCSGAIVLARLDRLIFGAYDMKAGAAGTLYNITSDNRLNHVCQTYGGILESECASRLSDFFKKLRNT